jgi:hypothetical protein
MLQEATENSPSWLLVAGHYPVYSGGSNGDIAELSTYLLPLLIKYKVHAYVSGHDHISEHLRRDGIEYFVAGAGSMTDQLKYATQAELVWYGIGYSAYASMEATIKELTITFRDWNNTVRYAYTLKNPFSVSPPRQGDHDDHLEGIVDNIGIPKIRQTKNNLIVTVSCGGVALIGIILLLVVYRERTKMIKRTKNGIKVLDPADEDFLYAISPNRRRKHHHYPSYKSTGSGGIELLEMSILNAHKLTKQPMTTMATTTYVDTNNVTIQDETIQDETMDAQSLMMPGDPSLVGTVFSALTIETEDEPNNKSVGYRSHTGYIRIKPDTTPIHRRVQTSPI